MHLIFVMMEENLSKWDFFVIPIFDIFRTKKKEISINFKKKVLNGSEKLYSEYLNKFGNLD